MYFVDDDFRMLFNIEEQKAYAINQREGKVYSIQWMIFEFLYYSSMYNVSLGEIELKNKDIVDRTIGKLLELNIISEYGSERRKVDKVVEKIDYHILNTVQIEITNNCNLDCKHCYLGSLKSHSLKLDRVKRVVDDAKKMGVSKIAITGGEPLIHSNIREILSYLYEKEIYTELYTNGYLLDDEFCNYLRSINIGTVHLSLDGHMENIHDKFRGKNGSFKKNLVAISNLQRLNVPIVVTCVLNRYNIDYVNEIIDFFEGNGLVYKLDYLINEGKAVDNISEVCISFEEYATCISKMLEKRFGYDEKALFSRGKFCGAGTEFVYITAHGEVKICPSISEGAYGNVIAYSLEEIWKKNYNKYSFIHCDKMDSCEFSDVCCGGCRSRAFSIHHDINAPDTVMCEVLNKYRR